MSNITKRAMAQSLKKMLLVKDIDKITITDITNDCGENRKRNNNRNMARKF